MDQPDLTLENRRDAGVAPSASVRPPVPQPWNQAPAPFRPQPASARESGATVAPYEPQFSPAAVEYINSSQPSLRPLQSAIGPAGPRPQVLTVTFPPARPVTFGPEGPPDLSRLPRTVTLPLPTLNPSTKRKRENHSYTQHALPDHIPPIPGSVPPVPKEFPTITKPALRKKKSCADAILVCERCKATSSLGQNPILVCALCFEAHHQLCHVPQPEDPRNFVCHRCAKEKDEWAEYHRLVLEQEDEKQFSLEYWHVENQRRRNMVGFSQFKKPLMVGFSAGESTHEERVQYFSKLSKTDLVNLLLFSEAHVDGGLLVNVLASVAKKHHDLPLFPNPEWAQEFREPPEEEEPVPTGAHAQATTSLRKPKNKKHRISAIRKLQDTAATSVDRTVPDADEEKLPALWPKPRQGLYATLSPENKDKLLYDDQDEEAFSHFMGSGPVAQVIPPVGG